MNVLTLGDQAGRGDWVALSMDFAGFRSVEGVILLSLADCWLLVKAGGLMYLGHGEKFTRFELRLEVSGPGSKDLNDESLGVWAVNGETLWFSSIVMCEVVLGGVGGRAERLSTMIKLKNKMKRRNESNQGSLLELEW